LLFRVLNRFLQPVVAEEMSPRCRSFLPGGDARRAFRGVLAGEAIDDNTALRLDLRDYFNSIDVEDLLHRLSARLSGGPLGALLAASPRDPRVIRDGVTVDGGRKGCDGRNADHAASRLSATDRMSWNIITDAVTPAYLRARTFASVGRVVTREGSWVNGGDRGVHGWPRNRPSGPPRHRGLVRHRRRGAAPQG